MASSPTSAQLCVLVHLLAFHLLLIVLGLGGAPVALPLQHMADDHSQQAQQEEDGHQDEGHVVWLGFQGSLLPGPCRLPGWRSQREDKKKKSSSECHGNVLRGKVTPPTGYEDAAETQMKQLWGLKCH